MTLRNRLFFGFALALGLVIPLALGLEYRSNAAVYRDHMGEQSRYVAELLQEKVIEPLDDIEARSREKGLGGSWEGSALDLKNDHATTWHEQGGKHYPVSASMLVEYLREIPLVNSGYPFILDQRGTLVACPKDLPDVSVVLDREQTNRAFGLRGPDREIVQTIDPLYHQPCDLVLLSVPRVGLAVGLTFPLLEISESLQPVANAVLQLAAVLLVLMWILCYLLARHVTAPLEKLTRAVKRTVKGELDVPLIPSSIREVSELSAAFSKMRSDLADYVEQIRLTSTESARVARELELARVIQGNADLCLSLDGWTASGKSEPAREVGGDLMDIFALPDGRLGLLVGDVAGKGIPAALYTLLARSGLKLGLVEGRSPAQALAQANSLLVLNNPDAVFVSALVAVFEPRTSELIWARAGHPTPLCEEGPLLGPNGPPLGLLDTVSYQDVSTILSAQSYMLYTDGFPEAENEAGEFLGTDPLRQAMTSKGSDIWTLLARHRGAAEASDDATAILLRRS